MSIILSQNGKNAQRLEKLSFGLEGKLQTYIYDNPEVIPLYDIKDDIKLLILAREFSTESGPIDALGIDQDGQIYLIETKLYKNPDKRTVIAQVLDYGASLWKHANDFDSFITQLDKHTNYQFKKKATDKIVEFFTLSLEEADLVLEQMKHNLNEGNFKFVVLMDNLHDQLKDLIVYMNQNSKFDIYGVELEYYKHEQQEIIIPKIYGTQVKKDLDNKKTASGRKKWDEKSFFEDAINKLNSRQLQAIKKIYAWSLKNSLSYKWGTGSANGSFNPRFKATGHNAFLHLMSNGEILISYGYLPELELKIKLRDILAKHLTLDSITNLTDDQLDAVWLPIKADYVEQNIDQIITAVNEFIS